MTPDLGPLEYVLLQRLLYIISALRRRYTCSVLLFSSVFCGPDTSLVAICGVRAVLVLPSCSSTRTDLRFCTMPQTSMVRGQKTCEPPLVSQLQSPSGTLGIKDPANDLEIVRIKVGAGGCSIHNGRTWHGSGPNVHPLKVCSLRFRS